MSNYFGSFTEQLLWDLLSECGYNCQTLRVFLWKIGIAPLKYNSKNQGFAAAEQGKDQRCAGTIYHEPMYLEITQYRLINVTCS